MQMSNVGIFPLTFLPPPLPLSVYYPDVPTRTALELPAPKDKSVDKGAAVPPAEAVSANPAQAVAIPPAMKNRPLPDIPTESVSQLKPTSLASDNANAGSQGET